MNQLDPPTRPPAAPFAYSVVDAAGMIGIGRSTMYALITTGQIPTVSIGRRRLVTEGALTAFLARLSDASEPT